MKHIMTLKTEEEKNLENAFEEFLRVKRINNVSKETVRHYKSTFSYFSEFAGNETLCSAITNNTVLEYIEHLRKAKKVSDISINTYLRGLRAFLYFCMELGYMNQFSI